MSNLFGIEDDNPVVVNNRDCNLNNYKAVGNITIMRPYRYQNPFIIGAILTLQDIQTSLGKLPYFDELVNIEFISKNLPDLFKVYNAQLVIDRATSIKLFREWWGYCRNKGYISDSEILELRGKTLRCGCNPKPCHGDVIVSDYRVTLDWSKHFKSVPVGVPLLLHDSTSEVVIATTERLLGKLNGAQQKYNLDNGWKLPPSHAIENDGRYFLDSEGCVKALFKHLEKGDVLDSIAYLVFLSELEGDSKIKILEEMFKKLKVSNV